MPKDPGAKDELDFGSFKAEDRLGQVERATALGHTINFGWLPPARRTVEQTRFHTRTVGAMPLFRVRGPWQANERRYALWQAARMVLGKHLPYVWQQTGACVGAAGGCMQMTAQCVEIALKREPEEFKVPWWLFTYGRSRFHAGMRGQGEGSIGSAYAKAATEDGYFEIDPEGAPDLPDYKIEDGWLVQLARTELAWSDGARISSVWMGLGKKHLFRTAAPVRSAAELYEAMVNGYACTIAGMLGCVPMVPRPVSDPPVRLGRWSPLWGHQEWVDEAWDHPKLGLIFRIGNQWGPTAHGSPTGEEPPGGYYQTEKDVDRILRGGDSECYAFSGLDGFPARQLSFAAF